MSVPFLDLPLLLPTWSCSPPFKKPLWTLFPLSPSDFKSLSLSPPTAYHSPVAPLANKAYAHPFASFLPITVYFPRGVRKAGVYFPSGAPGGPGLLFPPSPFFFSRLSSTSLSLESSVSLGSFKGPSLTFWGPRNKKYTGFLLPGKGSLLRLPN